MCECVRACARELLLIQTRNANERPTTTCRPIRAPLAVYTHDACPQIAMQWMDARRPGSAEREERGHHEQEGIPDAPGAPWRFAWSPCVLRFFVGDMRAASLRCTINLLFGSSSGLLPFEGPFLITKTKAFKTFSSSLDSRLSSLAASRLAVVVLSRSARERAGSSDMTGGLTSARTYYTKVAAASFLIGASMELFMIRTGFYEKVTSIEAEERRERLRAQQQLVAGERGTGEGKGW